jgi:hypothetical protein
LPGGADGAEDVETPVIAHPASNPKLALLGVPYESASSRAGLKRRECREEGVHREVKKLAV